MGISTQPCIISLLVSLSYFILNVLILVPLSELLHHELQNLHTIGMLTVSVCRSSSLDWKKDQNWTEPKCKRPHWLQLHKFWNFRLPVARFVEKSKNRKKNQSRPVAIGISSCHVLELTHAHIYLIVGLWILKNSQELVVIWPKTFLYATQMYVPSIFAISQLNLNEIAWNINQSTWN